MESLYWCAGWPETLGVCIWASSRENLSLGFFDQVRLRMRRLICAFVVCLWHKQAFSWHGSYVISTLFHDMVHFNTLLISCLNSREFWSTPFRVYLNDILLSTIRKFLTKLINWRSEFYAHHDGVNSRIGICRQSSESPTNSKAVSQYDLNGVDLNLNQYKKTWSDLFWIYVLFKQANIVT